MTQNRAQPLASTDDRLAFPPCLHRQREYVGSSNGAVYQRCLLCDAVLVGQGGRIWVLPARTGQ